MDASAEDPQAGPVGVHLRRTPAQDDAVDAFVERVGPRVGLAGVLDDLDHAARVVRVPAPAAVWGFRWDAEDSESRRWWPQGITSSGDASADGLVLGRSVLVTSAYSQVSDGTNQGSRLTFVDLTDPTRVRYRHVLLVSATQAPDGHVEVSPVRVHAGGIVWHGDHVLVAGTAAGFAAFRLDDIVRAPTGDAARLRIRDDPPAAVDMYGHRYVLPLRFTYRADATPGVPLMRYSFASLDRSASPSSLVVGEYGRGGQTTRLGRYDVDPSTALLRADEADGLHRPTTMSWDGVMSMQGAAVVDDTWFVTASHGHLRLGSLWVGRPGDLHEIRRQLPVGPEDITYWPQRDQLWSLSEYPGARFVYAMSRDRLLRR